MHGKTLIKSNQVAKACFISGSSYAVLPLREISLHLSLPKHSLCPCSSPPHQSATLLCIYSFILTIYLTTGLPLLLKLSISLTYTLFTNYTLFFSLNMTKPSQSISFQPFHYTTLPFIGTRSHATPFIHVFIALTLSPCHATCSFQITFFHSMYS